MTVTYRYANAEQTVVVSSDNRSFPAIPDNMDYKAIVDAGLTIGPYVPPPVTADHVRAECQRRMMALFGARDAKHLDVLVSNAGRESTRLLYKRIGGAEWTPEEAARASYLAGADALIEALRAKSNALEAMSPIPANYTSDIWWS